MDLRDFHFDLPPELIAQEPIEPRSASRLLALDAARGTLRDLKFSDLPDLLAPNDLLVFNDTRVIPARAHGVKESGGRVEILLERVLAPHRALVQLRASKGLRVGGSVQFGGGVNAHMVGREGEFYELEFSDGVLKFLEAHGEVPLPPYIQRAAEASDRDRYQTLFARSHGAVAAPTAGLHFDVALFEALAARQIKQTFVTLHVGAGTFAPVRVKDIDTHVMHAEYLEVPQSACDAINDTRRIGGRIVAVGTTVVRSLETAALANATGDGTLVPYQGTTRIFIKPGFRFRAVDVLVTNFHLPQSTLLMLCSAFIGREALLGAYRHAVEARYRFFSYGDAMFLAPNKTPHAL
jgi:S-adenosylmethionine:tRNA ribosyltransferase-isomerase